MILCNRLKLTNFTIWQLAMLALGVVSMSWSVVPVTSAVYAMLVGVILSFCIISVIDTPDRLDKCVWGFIIGCDLMGILIIATGQLPDIEEGERLGEEITGNANSFSVLLMLACALAFWKVLCSKNVIVKLICIVSAIFQMVLMAYSGGRKTIIAVLICLVWFALSKDTHKKFRMIKNVLIAAAAIAVFVLAITNIPFLYQLIGERFEGLFDLMSGGESNISGDAMREKMIEIGLDRWMESPIWGYGVDTFKYYNKTVTGHFYYAHNNYVEILYDLGIIGFVVYYGFIAYMTNELRKKWKSAPKYCSLGIGIIIMTLVYDFGGISFYTVFTIMMLAFAYTAINIAEKESLEPSGKGEKITQRR
jgi:O-antigen ligase